MDFLHELQPWHWLIIVFVCLGLEALGAGGFLLGTAAASALLALLLWLIPDISWPAQLVYFGIASLLLTLAYWKFFRKINEENDYPQLNDRSSQLIGTVIVLDHDLAAGPGKIQIGDTFWRVQSSTSVARGESVLVTGNKGMVLIVARQNDESSS